MSVRPPARSSRPSRPCHRGLLSFRIAPGPCRRGCPHLTGGETEAWRGKGASLKVTRRSGGEAARDPGPASGGLAPGRERGRAGGREGRADGRSPDCGAEAPGLNPSPPRRSATAATAPPAAPAGEGGPPGPPPNLTSNRRLQQTQAQVDEVSWGGGRHRQWGGRAPRLAT